MSLLVFPLVKGATICAPFLTSVGRVHCFVPMAGVGISTGDLVFMKQSLHGVANMRTGECPGRTLVGVSVW